MQKFVLHYKITEEARKEMMTLGSASPEERAAVMKPWMEWKESMGDKMLDFGGPVMQTHKMTAAGDFTSSVAPVNGYNVIQAENIEEVKKLLQGHPHLKWRDDTEIEIYEVMSMGAN